MIGNVHKLTSKPQYLQTAASNGKLAIHVLVPLLAVCFAYKNKAIFNPYYSKTSLIIFNVSSIHLKVKKLEAKLIKKN